MLNARLSVNDNNLNWIEMNSVFKLIQIYLYTQIDLTWFKKMFFLFTSAPCPWFHNLVSKKFLALYKITKFYAHSKWLVIRVTMVESASLHTAREVEHVNWFDLNQPVSQETETGMQMQMRGEHLLIPKI